MEIELDARVEFAADGAEPATARLRSVRRDGGLAAVVETDAETAGRGLFHDTPENRLDAFELGFDRASRVLIELELRPEWHAALPPAGADLGAWAAELPVELLREDAWNAREVWQERPLHESIGGGSIRVGYRTVFAAPRDEIDALKRRGSVTRTVVEALIENGLPVRFEAGAFEFALAVDDRGYRCRLTVDEEAASLALTVFADGVEVSGEAIEVANQQLLTGAFERDGDGLSFVYEIAVDPPMASESWVIETLRAGVSVMHHFATA